MLDVGQSFLGPSRAWFRKVPQTAYEGSLSPKERRLAQWTFQEPPARLSQWQIAKLLGVRAVSAFSIVHNLTKVLLSAVQTTNGIWAARLAIICMRLLSIWH